MNLTEATIKALYDGLTDDVQPNGVDGIVSDVLVITDPEITTEEYDELIERAQELVDETPEGDIPFMDDYLGNYLQICPICGATFAEDHLLEPGASCPVCLEQPESFVMVGKIETEDDVAIDNGLEDEIDEEFEKEFTFNRPEEDVEEDVEETPDAIVGEESEEEKEDNRLKDVASKQISGNKIVESKDAEDKSVKVLCYGEVTEYATRKEAISHFRQAMSCSEGAERERYTNIYLDLIETDDNFVYDYEDEYRLYKNEINREQEHQERLDKEAIIADYMKYVDDEWAKGNQQAKDFQQWLRDRDSIKEEDYQTLTEFYNKKVEADKEDNTEKEFTLDVADDNKISELEHGSAFTWEGMVVDAENLSTIVEALKEETSISLPVRFYTWTGEVMNNKYGLTGRNAYPEDLTFLSIDLDNWGSMDGLIEFKFSVGARWLDDIVDNNKVRQDKIDGVEDSSIDEDMIDEVYEESYDRAGLVNKTLRG